MHAKTLQVYIVGMQQQVQNSRLRFRECVSAMQKPSLKATVSGQQAPHLWG